MGKIGVTVWGWDSHDHGSLLCVGFWLPGGLVVSFHPTVWHRPHWLLEAGCLSCGVGCLTLEW